MKKIWLLLVAFCLGNRIVAQTFEQIPAEISVGYFGYLTAADLDNDGDPEIVHTTIDRFNVLKNSGGAFEPAVQFPEFRGESQGNFHTLDAGDINRDGYIDLLQTGGPNNRVFHILLNTHPGFTNAADKTHFSGQYGSCFLGDMEADGDLDILSHGGIVLNKDNNFVNGPWFTKYTTWFASWCNFDEDSDLEIIQSTGTSSSFTGNYIYDNGFPSLTVKKTLPISPSFNHISYADYDADGDLDMLAMQPGTTRIYKNNDGDLVDTNITFPQSRTIDFGDINNDGLFDIVLGGVMTATWQVFETAVYLNQGDGTFFKFEANIPSGGTSSATVADIDGDGDLDIPTESGIFRNNSSVINGKPSSPGTTSSIVSGSTVNLSWGAGTDDKTPNASLTYNISVRDEIGNIIVPSHSLSSGKRQIFKMGNAANRLSFQLNCLKPGTYYWQVQAIDAAYCGSSFSLEQSFTITQVAPAPPAELTARPVSDMGIELTWIDQSETEDEYIIFRKHSNSPFGFAAMDTVAANETYYLDTIYLEPQTAYEYRVAASNCAYQDEFNAETSATTFPLVFVNSGWLDLGEVEGSLVRLGDFDNDKDLDMLLTTTSSWPAQTKLYRFVGDGYVDTEITLPECEDAYWFDHNNDGFMDLLLVSPAGFFDTQLILFQNIGGTTFSQATNSGLPTDQISWRAGISFGDYDNDGDTDLLAQSNSEAGNAIVIFDNDGTGKFIKNEAAVLTGHISSSSAWIDYDNDGDLDIVASKEMECYSNILIFYENLGAKTFSEIKFTDLQGNISDVFDTGTDMDWGDFDSDGDQDLVIAGQHTCSNGDGVTRIYRNEGNRTFIQVAEFVRLIYDANVDWADYDNDGDLDLFAYGDPRTGSAPTRIYKNNENQFKETNIDYLLQSNQSGHTALGDIDNDGDLDYVILGEIDYVNPRVFVYRNNVSEQWGLTNHRPAAPASLLSTIHPDQSVTLSWGKANDQETDQAGLTYNFYLIHDTDSIIVNSYALADGHRQVAARGNASSVTSVNLNNLKPGMYRWAVQAIDHGFAGSVFSEEQTFNLLPPEVLVEHNFTEFETGILQTSAFQSYTISGSQLREAIHIFSTDNFLVSVDSQSGYSSSLDLQPEAGVLSKTTVYVIFHPDAAGTSNGVIANATRFLQDVNLNVSGIGLFLLPTAIEAYERNDIYFYPNPVEETLHIQATDVIKKVLVYSITGMEVFAHEFQDASDNVSVEVRELPAGAYIIYALSEKKTVYHQQFIKSR